MDVRTASGIRRTSYILKCATGDPPIAAIAALILKACEVLPQDQPPASWDSIMFCIRPDSGRLFASPGLRGKFSPDRRAVTWVYFPDLEQQCYDLPEPQDHDTQAFDAAHSKLVEDLFASVRAAARLPQPAASLAKLRQTHPLKTYRIEYDDLETLTELDI